MQLNALLKENSNNYYKMLVIIDNNNQYERITSKLDGDGWSCYDVTKHVISLMEEIPENKRKVRIGSKIKTWFNELPDKVILYNTNILYSPELGRINPIGAFKYKSRTKEIIIFVEGHVFGDRIQYSEYGRPDFVEMDVSELIHAKMEDIDD